MINIPKVVHEIDLGEYANELAGQRLHVWVNPPLAVLRAHDEIVKTDSPENERKLFEWYAVLLSQFVDADTHVSADELKAYREADPAFWTYIVREVWRLRGDFLAKKKRS